MCRSLLHVSRALIPKHTHTCSITHEGVIRRRDESCLTWINHVAHEGVMSHMDEFCLMWLISVELQKWVMSYSDWVMRDMKKRHAKETYVCEKRPTYVRIRNDAHETFLTHECLTWMSHVLHEGVMSQTWLIHNSSMWDMTLWCKTRLIHVRHSYVMNESCLTWLSHSYVRHDHSYVWRDWVESNIWMSRVSHVRAMWFVWRSHLLWMSHISYEWVRYV